MTELKIEVDLVADMTVYNPFDFFVEEEAENCPFDYPEDLRDDLEDLPEAGTDWGAALYAFLATVDRVEQRTIDMVVGLNARLQRHVGYVIRMEPGVQTPEETLDDAPAARAAIRAGCWCRSCASGLAARFVSGYLIQLKPDLKALDGPSGTEHRFHRPACLVPRSTCPAPAGSGLIRPRGLLTGESHIPLAATPHYRNAAPISGGFSAMPRRTDFDFDMKVSRVAEHPRITKPFSDESWEALECARREGRPRRSEGRRRAPDDGRRADLRLDRRFRSRRNGTPARSGRPSAKQADNLIRRLRERFAPGGFLHYGQGKWYPGETLPRWTFSLYWRRDGKPIWHEPELIAGENGNGTGVEGRGRANAAARRWPRNWALAPEMVHPGL